MKRVYKIILRRIIMVSILAFILLFNGQDNSVSINARNIDTFSKLLDTHNISVAGLDCYLTDYQLEGFINMLDSRNSEVIDKYTKILETEENKIKLSSREILELHYYGLPVNEQDDFITRIANQRVDVSMTDNAFLISYN
jgi:hypothetical protein